MSRGHELTYLLIFLLHLFIWCSVAMCMMFISNAVIAPRLCVVFTGRFIFIMGAAMAIVFNSHHRKGRSRWLMLRDILIRSIKLFVLGLMVNSSGPTSESSFIVWVTLWFDSNGNFSVCLKILKKWEWFRMRRQLLYIHNGHKFL